MDNRIRELLAEGRLDYKVNKPYLVAGAWRRTDRTGIQVQPEFTGHNERIRITVTCRHS